MAEGQDPTDITSELDPDRECDPVDVDPNTGMTVFQRFTVLAPCKNNCRGGKIFTYISGKQRNTY